MKRKVSRMPDPQQMKSGYTNAYVIVRTLGYGERFSIAFCTRHVLSRVLCIERCISANRPGGEVGEIRRVFRRAGIVRSFAQMFRREAKSKRGSEFFQRLHLPVEPGLRLGPKRIGPTQARPKVLHAELSKP